VASTGTGQGRAREYRIGSEVPDVREAQRWISRMRCRACCVETSHWGPELPNADTLRGSDGARGVDAAVTPHRCMMRQAVAACWWAAQAPKAATVTARNAMTCRQHTQRSLLKTTCLSVQAQCNTGLPCLWGSRGTTETVSAAACARRYCPMRQRGTRATLVTTAVLSGCVARGPSRWPRARVLRAP
jgi:hypothetical protein